MKRLIPIYRIVWAYWLGEDDNVVKVLGYKTALVDSGGQRIKMQPMIWRTIINKWKYLRCG